MKKIIITLIIGVIISLAESQTAFASNIILSALSGSGTNTVGTAFNVSVQVDPMGNSFDVVKGTIVFDKLTCQSITLANGPLSIVVPTCATPNFVIGIPKGTSVSQNLFSVSVKGRGVGQAIITFTGVKVIKAGSDVAFSIEGSSYDIVAANQTEVPQTTPTSTTPTVVPTENVSGSESTPDAGLQIPSGVGEFSSTSNNVENISTTTSSSSEVAPTEKDTGLVATAILGFSNIPNKAMAAIIIVAVILISGLMYYTRRNDKNTPDKPNPTESF